MVYNNIWIALVAVVFAVALVATSTVGNNNNNNNNNSNNNNHYFAFALSLHHHHHHPKRTTRLPLPQTPKAKTTTTTTTTTLGRRRCFTSTTILHEKQLDSSSSSSNIDSSSSPSSTSKSWIINQRSKFDEYLTTIERLQNELAAPPVITVSNNNSSSTETTETTTETTIDTNNIDNIKSEIDLIEKKLNFELLYNQPLPPKDITIEEYKNAITSFMNMPPFLRLAFVLALQQEQDIDEDIIINEEMAKDPYSVPTIITKLYEKQARLTPQLMKDAMKKTKQTLSSGNNNNKLISTMRTSNNNNNGIDIIINDETSSSLSSLDNFFSSASSSSTMSEENIKNFIPRVARKEEEKENTNNNNNVAVVGETKDDLQILIKVLKDDKSMFVPKSKLDGIPIPGGYVIPGTNLKSNGNELIECLDTKLPKNWDCTVSYMLDLSNLDDEDIDIGSALILLKKDFNLITNPIFYGLSTFLAIISTLLFAVGVYGGNDAVLNRLSSDASMIGDFTTLDWFNGKVLDIILPITIILLSHEIGHSIIAKKEKIETDLFPTLLPIWSGLPLFGSLTRLKSSPRNLSVLFDYAFLGPLFGFISSFIFLGLGLVATKSILLEGGVGVGVDGVGNSGGGVEAAAQYLPALPVSVIKLSTLGSSIIDNYLGGGDGQITSLSDNTQPVSLHPYAIAGYCGILINAVEMLPLGANDGGRLSMTLFGRQGHTVIGGVTWLALLIASFNLTEEQSALLVAAWIINNVVQNDQEIPCRDETENINLPRSLAAFALWFLSILVFVPL